MDYQAYGPSCTYSGYLNNNIPALDGSPFIAPNEFLCKPSNLILASHNIERI